MTLDIQTPTDAQLAYVASLCEERGYPQPAVYSKQHASILIEELRARTYRPPEWLDDDYLDGLDPADEPDRLRALAEAYGDDHGE